MGLFFMQDTVYAMNKECLKSAKYTKYAKNINKNAKKGVDFCIKMHIIRSMFNRTKMEIKVKWRT